MDISLHPNSPTRHLSPFLLSDDEEEEEVRFKCFRVDSFVNAILENIISNILLIHSLDLEAFHPYDDWKFSCQNVWKCVWIIVQNNVQHITLDHYDYTSGEL